MSNTVAVDLTISSTPPSGADFPTATVTAAASKTRLWSKSETFTRNLAGAVNTNIFPSAMTQVECLYVKVSGGSVTLKLTSAAGAAQIVPVDTFFVLITSTQPLTAITVSGTADIEVFAAGQ